MCANGRPPNGLMDAGNEHHLTRDELNHYLDGDLTPMERRFAERHLSTCASCQTELADTIAIVNVLRSMPQAPTPRSFQLGPEFVTQRQSFWQRFGASLLPVLPALRAGTLALALALGGVTAYRVAQDQPDSQLVSQDPVGQSTGEPTGTDVANAVNTDMIVPTSTLTAPEPTATLPANETFEFALEPTPATENDSRALEESAPDQLQPGPTDAIEQESDTAPVEDESSAAGSNLADDSVGDLSMESALSTQTARDGAGVAEVVAGDDANISMAAPSDSETSNAALAVETAESKEASPPAPLTAPSTSSPTAAATTIPPAAISEPTATQTPVAETEDDETSWLGLSQILLGVLLIGMGALVIGLGRLRKQAS